MNSENQNIEYKETWRDEYLKWVCGFDNTPGGKIYDGVKLSQIELNILNLLANKPTITYLATMKELELSESTVTRSIRKLRSLEYISRQGSDKSGYWLINEKGKQIIETTNAEDK